MDARIYSGACIVPNKNVIQGMDLVYSQTKSGHPDINYWKTKCSCLSVEHERRG